MNRMKRYLYRAPYVVPVGAPLIEDGAVLTGDGTILEIGPFSKVDGTNAELVDYEGHILTPALINAHAHLELSYLAHIGSEMSQPESSDITAWIRRLLQARDENTISEDEQEFVAWQALAHLYASGCRVVADIGNRIESRTIGKNFKAEVLFFLEMLGISTETQRKALKRLDDCPSDLCCTAHAPYSSGPELIKRLKQRARALGCLFPLHVAESADEIDFLQNGDGRFKDFLQERGVWDGSFTPPGTGAVSYLESLNVLDEKTLCVHSVHVTDEEIDILASHHSKVCLCPGSNRYMGVGKAPIAKFIERGINPALGTDSLASNTMLNLWREMQLLHEDHPALAPENIFKMATVNGAAALDAETEFGTLASGKSSAFLAVRNKGANKDEIYEFLASVGKDVQLEWVE